MRRYEITDEAANRVGKLHDPVTEHGLFPVIGVFARKIPTTKDDPVVKVIEKVEELTKKYQKQPRRRIRCVPCSDEELRRRR